MGAWLFPIAFDLFAPTFITGPGYPSSFLQRIRMGDMFRFCDRVGALRMRQVCIIMGIILRIAQRRIIFMILGLEEVRKTLRGGHGGRQELVAGMQEA